MRAIIDRIEDGVAVVELDDNQWIHLPAHLLPADAREGSVLALEVGSGPTATHLAFRIDEEGAAARRVEIETLRNSIPRGPDGDLSL